MEDWQPINTAPHNEELLFWIVPKSSEEAYIDMSVHSIFVDLKPYIHRGKLLSWSSLSKATHWMRLPSPPREN